MTVSICIYLSALRYGKPGCDAETCDYFLSYRRIGTDVEFELSADTDGWVAVGFSSDKKMVSSSATSLTAKSYTGLVSYLGQQTMCLYLLGCIYL